MGHHPHPAPTAENPERWDCDCGGLWRILTLEQIEKKWIAARMLVRRDRDVGADLDVVNVGRRPVAPLLVAHVVVSLAHIADAGSGCRP